MSRFKKLQAPVIPFLIWVGLALEASPCIAQESAANEPPARWFRSNPDGTSSWTIENGYSVLRNKLAAFEPEITRAILKWSADETTGLELHLEVADLDEDSWGHLLRIGDSYLQFSSGFLWPYRKGHEPSFDSADGGDPFAGIGDQEEETPNTSKPSTGPRGWIAHIQDLDKARAALKVLQKLHDLPNSRVLDGTLIGGLSPYPQKVPPPKSGWFVYDFDPDRLVQELAADGVYTRRISVRLFPLPLAAARLRVDSERDDSWWLEFDIESGPDALDIMGHFQDHFILGIEGTHGSGFSIRGHGYMANPDDDSFSSSTIAMGIADLDAGRRILKELREIHSNLPNDAIIDVTLGESHGKIHRFRKSHLSKTMADWERLSEALRCLSTPPIDQSENWWEAIRSLNYLARMNDPTDLGIEFYVPYGHEEAFQKEALSIKDLKINSSLSINDVIDQVLPEEWMAFPLAPRWVALLPKSAVYDDTE